MSASTLFVLLVATGIFSKSSGSAYDEIENEDFDFLECGHPLEELFFNETTKREGNHNVPVFVNAEGFEETSNESDCLFLRLLNQHWQGLFIGPHSSKFDKIPGNAKIMPKCVSTKTTPMVVPANQDNKDCQKKHQCFPLFAIMMANESPKVDYLRLNTDGQELLVLKTIPWNQVNISAISIAHHASADSKDIRDFLNQQNYEVYKTDEREDFFVRSSIFKKRNFPTLPKSF